MYHCHEDGMAHTPKKQTSGTETCTKGTRNVYTCGQETYEAAYSMPSGHDWDANYKCKNKNCNTEGTDINSITIAFGIEGAPDNGDHVYVYTDDSIRPDFFARDEKAEKTLTWSRSAGLNTNGTMKDLLVSWSNSDGVGNASVNFIGKGDYYGERQLKYTIIPCDPTNLTVSNLTTNSVKLTWSGALGADAYNIYKVTSGKPVLIQKTTATNYTVTGLTSSTEYTFVVESTTASMGGDNKNYTGANPVEIKVTTTDRVADALHSVTASGSTVTVVFNGTPAVMDGSWKVLVGVYDASGKMTGAAVKTVTGPSVNLTVPDAELADKLMAFVMDGLGQPRMKELEVEQ